MQNLKFPVPTLLHYSQFVIITTLVFCCVFFQLWKVTPFCPHFPYVVKIYYSLTLFFFYLAVITVVAFDFTFVHIILV